MTRRRFLAAGLIALVVAAIALPAVARVGGGHAYSHGRSSGGSGGGGGDGGALFQILFFLLLQHPAVGVPVLIAVVLFMIWSKRNGIIADSAASDRMRYGGGILPPPPQRRVDLSPLVAVDPNFSEPVFTDFAQLVYAFAEEMRGAGKREPLASWISEEAMSALFAGREGLHSVRDVIVGSTRIAAVAADGRSPSRVVVEIESNVTEVRGGAGAPLLCRETWTFRRAAGVLSPPPERMRVLACAGCGSPEEPKTDGTCPSCGSVRTGGRTQWEVAAIARLERRALTPPELAPGGGVEPGATLPTVFDPGLPAARRAFEARHPDHSWESFANRVRDAFVRLQRAWSTQRWEEARPFETDSLFQVHRFRIERYKAFGLVNRVEQPEIRKLEIVRISKDAFYEAVTVRLLATVLDWTEDREGKVVGGSRTEPRTFAEYWTFLRAIGAKKRADGEPGTCPSCGAPADKVTMAGVCDYCGSKITTGEFDWVLSRIDQSEAY